MRDELTADRHQQARDHRSGQRQDASADGHDTAGEPGSGEHGKESHVDDRESGAVGQPRERVPEGRRRFRARNSTEHRQHTRLAQDPRRRDLILGQRLGEGARQTHRGRDESDAGYGDSGPA